MAVKAGDITDILSFMETQNNYINNINKIISLLYVDLNIINNKEFREFVTQFQQFTIYHFSSEGFTKSITAMQVFHHVLLEKLLDKELIYAAEYLDMAAECLELSSRDMLIKSNF